ncbi:hypothetical protein PHLCEN_2v10751 [Hermanssonia centrifuga]|uniref:Uncharacterized protein n=1 Tax=Hermanssonia centrifuga TaxID=98765 RepID=A0A2R6NM89_9APHY|nr:hypothetical protein PHLCEN_2v10751 [Hermanssonia centrifuga]
MICLWDLRVGDADEFLKKPVMVINKAHGTGRTAGRKGKLTAPPARGVTSVCFSGCDEYGVISGGSYDGVLRQWDLRYLSSKRYTSGQNSVPKAITSPSLLSSADPTTYKGDRRARGITSLVVGSGASAGLLFALSNDSRVHTYDMSTLEPLSGWTEDPSNDLWSYGHENMHTNSFYVRLAMSPCGRWLASGGAANGSVYLFDVTSSSANRRGPAFSDGRGLGVELQGQKGEVGAVDWAEGMVACCADDGTVRIWRQDLETYRSCEDDPEEMKWRWSWSANIR